MFLFEEGLIPVLLLGLWVYCILDVIATDDVLVRNLAKYVELSPRDDTSRLHLLELELENRQSAEERLKYIKAELTRSHLTPFYESELRRREDELRRREQGEPDPPPAAS